MFQSSVVVSAEQVDGSAILIEDLAIVAAGTAAMMIPDRIRTTVLSVTFATATFAPTFAASHCNAPSALASNTMAGGSNRKIRCEKTCMHFRESGNLSGKQESFTVDRCVPRISAFP